MSVKARTPHAPRRLRRDALERRPQTVVQRGQGPQGQRISWHNAMGTLLQPGAVKVLEQYARQRVPHLVAALSPTPDVACCGVVLRYGVKQQPGAELRSLVGRSGRHGLQQSAVGRVGGTAQGRRGAQASGTGEDAEVLTRRAFVKTWSVPCFLLLRSSQRATAHWSWPGQSSDSNLG